MNTKHGPSDRGFDGDAVADSATESSRDGGIPGQGDEPDDEPDDVPDQRASDSASDSASGGALGGGSGDESDPVTQTEIGPATETDEGKPEVTATRRILLGEPLPSHGIETQLMPKHLALPIFASDPLSSVAYGPQEMLLILLLGGTATMQMAWPTAVAVMVLLAVVVISYRQVIKGYPHGGGSFEVVRRNLGPAAGLVVAAALMVDYVLTVAVSISSGVDNIVSAFPVLASWRLPIALGFVVFLLVINLRGTRDSSKTFAIPTYLFIGTLFLLIITGLVETVLGHAPVAESAQYHVIPGDFEGAALALLLLRAFASGCAALTGVEAIADGVPAFRHPKVRNAQATLSIMAAIAIGLFAGITAIALISGVQYVDDPCRLEGLAGCETATQPSVIAQLSTAVFGADSVLFYLTQVTTAAVLLFAANTAFNGFPILGAILARREYAPRSLAVRGDRLVYSNAMLALGFAAALLLTATQANVTTLIQMYVIGVFVSFTLAQLGMVRHWLRKLRTIADPHQRRQIRISLTINAVGVALTGIVLVIVTITKFVHGAWVVFLAMPILVLIMWSTHAYYRRVDLELAPDAETVFGSRGDHGIVLVDSLTKPILKSLDYAIASRHATLEAVHCIIDPDEAPRLRRKWAAQNIKVPLKLLPCPYRDIGETLAWYLKLRRSDHGPEVVTIYMPQLIVGHWWETLLHNRRARHIRDRLLLCRGVEVTLVPWMLASSERLFTREPWRSPALARSGAFVPRGPIRPVERKPLPPADPLAAAEAVNAATRHAEAELAMETAAEGAADETEPSHARTRGTGSRRRGRRR